MMDIKPWYMSRTIWASIVSIALGVAGAMGLATEGVDHAMITDQVVELASIASGAIAILGRLRATAIIG